MQKTYHIYHTERASAAGLPYGPALSTQTRRCSLDPYPSREEAEADMREMQARANGHDEYADALHVEAYINVLE